MRRLLRVAEFVDLLMLGRLRLLTVSMVVVTALRGIIRNFGLAASRNYENTVKLKRFDGPYLLEFYEKLSAPRCVRRIACGFEAIDWFSGRVLSISLSSLK